MITRTRARTKAASIKTSVDELHAAIDVLPADAKGDAVRVAMERLHRKLNGGARLMANFFDEPIETFSGGNDRPEDE